LVAKASGAAQRFVVASGDAGRRLDLFLAGQVDTLSRSQLARQIGQAAATVNGAVGAPSRKLKAGDIVVF
jgi:23S rRNA-/tRNA-specific pseudouridylate synthase